jgi:hypothetical protein
MGAQRACGAEMATKPLEIASFRPADLIMCNRTLRKPPVG